MAPGKRGRNGARRADRRPKEAPPLAEPGQEYARVVAMLGNNRVRARFVDKTERLCRIRGSMRRRMWVNVGDTVLVALRDELSDEAADIVYRYLPTDVLRLRRLGEPVHIAADEDEERMDDMIRFDVDLNDVPGPELEDRDVPAFPSSDSDSDLDVDDI